jgi:hypothetical protein
VFVARYIYVFVFTSHADLIYITRYYVIVKSVVLSLCLFGVCLLVLYHSPVYVYKNGMMLVLACVYQSIELNVK